MLYDYSYLHLRYQFIGYIKKINSFPDETEKAEARIPFYLVVYGLDVPKS